MRPHAPKARTGKRSAEDPYVPHSGNGGYHVSRYELDLNYRVSGNTLAATARLFVVATQHLSELSLDLRGLRATKVLINGKPASKLSQTARKLVITPAKPMAAGQPAMIEIRYGGRPGPIRGQWGAVGWEELDDGVIVAGQPDGAPSWFPCNDHPSDKASYLFKISCDPGYTVVCNGSLVSHETKGARHTWVYDQPEPMASYLATLHIGHYRRAPLSRKGSVEQWVVFPARRATQVVHDLKRQPQMMREFVDMFGKYPFKHYTVVVTEDALDIPLEAQALSTFGANHLDGTRHEERLVAHELAHQWFGNSLTVERWQHIWLNEGFACYAEWLWSERAGEATAAALATEHWRRLAGLGQELLLGDPTPALMFDDRLYKRGALTLHALRQVMGDAAFFALVQRWTRTYRHRTVTTEAFIDLAVRVSDVPVRPLLHQWIHECPLPLLPYPRGV